MKKILVTGGAGYIGSHTVKKLKNSGYDILVIDDFSTGNKKALLGVKSIKADIADEKKVKKILKEFKPEVVIHFAASKDAAESIKEPKKYFANNTIKTIILLNILLEEGINNFIFSSSAAVYGDVNEIPIKEENSTNPTNPYGLSKLKVENILKWYKEAYGFNYISLRYFNAGGADSGKLIGNMYPNSVDLISMVIKAALGKIPQFEIYGNDYQTKDGTCIRDIIHVEDLAEAHQKAVEVLVDKRACGIYNLGSQEGFSINEIVAKTKKITGVDFPAINTKRRKGDIVVSIASSRKAEKELGWKRERDLDDIIQSAWLWHKENGF